LAALARGLQRMPYAWVHTEVIESPPAIFIVGSCLLTLNYEQLLPIKGLCGAPAHPAKVTQTKS
jgi:hypothetical protein